MGRPGLAERWRNAAHRLRIEVHALLLACKDPRVPWYAKAVAALVVGYAFSPIDLIPDFVPVLGLLDDLVLLPLGVALALKLAPKAVLEECRAEAQRRADQRPPRNWLAAAVIVILWLALAAGVICIAFRAWT